MTQIYNFHILKIEYLPLNMYYINMTYSYNETK